ncbi:MAG: hypothetical protein DI587_36340 [Variovorax paradoxus]|nr:MAG: hypothetical protein DI583_36340 [Variovorax paradoxus]PZQ00776.1 MAG: hypothetical protein DI587_36340 [Variovorax paradoxus]
MLIDWRMQSWYSEYERYDKSNETVKYRELAAAVRSDKVQPVVKPRRLQTFDRTIEEVKVESESRAVVLVRIKNTTPLIPTEVPDKWDTEKRSKGDLYRYVLEKAGDNWRVAEVWEFADYISTWERRAPTDYRSPPSLTTEAAW